jgi:biotin carboxylase
LVEGIQMKPVLMVGGFDHIVQVALEEGVPLALFQNAADVTELQLNLEQVRLFDLSDIEHGIKLARVLHRRTSFAGVVSFVEGGLELAGRIRDDLGIAGNTFFPVSVTRDKVRMRRLLNECSFPSALFRACTNIDSLRSFYDELRVPLVVKPSNRSGTEGVMYVDSKDDLERAWCFATAWNSPAVLAEEFLDGPEILVAAQTLRGRHEIVAIEEQFTTERPYFIEKGHQTPARLEPETELELRRMTGWFLDLIRHEFGPSNIEFRLTSRGPRVIECNTRPAGDFSWEMQLLAHGVDLFRETLLALSADTLPPRRGKGSGAAATRFFVNENCKILTVTGIEKARTMPGVVRVVCRARPGDVLGRLTTESRQGYVLAIASTTAKASARAEAAFSAVEFSLAGGYSHTVALRQALP